VREIYLKKGVDGEGRGEQCIDRGLTGEGEGRGELSLRSGFPILNRRSRAHSSLG